MERTSINFDEGRRSKFFFTRATMVTTTGWVGGLGGQSVGQSVGRSVSQSVGQSVSQSEHIQYIFIVLLGQYSSIHHTVLYTAIHVQLLGKCHPETKNIVQFTQDAQLLGRIYCLLQTSNLTEVSSFLRHIFHQKSFISK